ncbi:unnamed protein product [Callosobruchus maculatus]|uniref:Uncharacterized protein n=1 Tax=Callosobruchus maculatus TaxID=64391 RepID=A0A653DQS5_CALMS|nr:unnamed protein product [Callosobruchus maculatus]
MLVLCYSKKSKAVSEKEKKFFGVGCVVSTNIFYPL